jgi:hypothetical protein
MTFRSRAGNRQSAQLSGCVPRLAETGMLAETGIRAGGACPPASVEGECLPAFGRDLYHCGQSVTKETKSVR